MSTDSTPRLTIPYIVASQAQKEVTHNDALNMIDALLNCRVASERADPPTSGLVEGNCYIVGSPATGAWVGKEKYIAQYIGGDWELYAPTQGLLVYDADAAAYKKFGGTVWETLYFPLANLSGTGTFGSTTGTTITIGTTMSDTNYKIFVQNKDVTDGSVGETYFSDITTTTFKVKNTGSNATGTFFWQVIA